MKSYPINEARAHFSELVERALAGEPQRVTRYGKEAVVIVSEREWRTRSRFAPTLGALLARCARAGRLDEDITDRPWTERPLDIEPSRRIGRSAGRALRDLGAGIRAACHGAMPTRLA